jgi:circadian clock protein KaiC
MDFVETGVPNLDLVLGGGLVAGSLTMVTGAPGCGKTILTQQIAVHAARQGRQVLVLTTLSEPHTKLLTYLHTLAFFEEQLIGERIELLNIYRQLTEDFANVSATIIRLVREQRATLLIVDSFDSVRGLAPSEMAAKEVIYELSAGLGLLGVTVIIVGATAGETAAALPELTIADSIVALHQELHGARSVRTLEVAKMRGAAQLNGRHTYRIDSAGVQVFPRQETVALPPEAPLGEERVAFGLAELDRMMGGGPTQGSNTAVIGNPGTGKTLLALQYVLQGHRRRERGLFVSFHETEQQLIAKAVALGLEAPAALADGVDFLHYVPAELDPDVVATTIRRTVAESQVKRLVVDGLDELLGGLLDQRQSGFISALMAYARNAGVTLCVTQEIGTSLEREAQQHTTSYSAYSDNIVLLRHLEYRAELHRVLSVIKMRDSDHDRTIREFRIGTGGLTVLTVDETGGEVLEALGRVNPSSRQPLR